MVDITKIMRYSDIKGISTKLGITPEEYIHLRKTGKKRCYVCEAWKCESDFRKDASKVDGMSARCRSCEHKKDYKFFRTVRGKYISYRKEAKRRGIPFKLSVDEFKTFWNGVCSYCGSVIDTIGIDRINSNVGYVIDNCVASCYRCNTMKLDMTEEEWFSHMKKILTYRKQL